MKLPIWCKINLRRTKDVVICLKRIQIEESLDCLFFFFFRQCTLNNEGVPRGLLKTNVKGISHSRKLIHEERVEDLTLEKLSSISE